MFIATDNVRRFRHETGVAVLAVYDTNRAFTLYGEVIAVDGRAAFDVSTIRTYFADELEELR